MNNHIKMKRIASLIGFIVTIAITILSLVIGIVPSANAADSPCLHGMRIVGDESIYLSHMGLFKSNCHDYQGIFEVAFTGENDPEQKYLNAQRSDPDKNEFTLRPQDKFVLGKSSLFKLIYLKVSMNVLKHIPNWLLKMPL
jgi:hypothetical protein